MRGSARFIVLMLLLSARAGAHGDHMAALERATHDSSWRVRLQAASVLSRVKDPRAIGLLESLLQDSQETVRRAAAIALAKQRGDTTAQAKASERNSHRDVTVKIGGVGAKSRNVKPEMTRQLRSLLEREFAHTPGTTIGGQPVTGYQIDGSIVTLDRRNTHDFTEVTAEISVIVGRLPSRAIVMMTSGGATVQEPKAATGAHSTSLETDALEGAVKGAHENLMAYLKTH